MAQAVLIKLDLFDGGKTAHFTTTFFGEHFPVVYFCQGWFNERTPAPVRYYFRFPCTESRHATLFEMKNELVVADCDFEYKDKYYTLDHRRLVAYRLAAREQSIVHKPLPVDAAVVRGARARGIKRKHPGHVLLIHI